MKKTEYLPPFQDRDDPEAWRVEGYNEETKIVRIAKFIGPEAEKEAQEFYAYKIGKLVIAPSAIKTQTSIAPAVTSAVPGELIITTRQGHKVRLRPDYVEWTYDVRKNRLSAVQISAVDLLWKGSSDDTSGV